MLQSELWNICWSLKTNEQITHFSLCVLSLRPFFPIGTDLVIVQFNTFGVFRVLDNLWGNLHSKKLFLEPMHYKRHAKILLSWKPVYYISSMFPTNVLSFSRVLYACTEHSLFAHLEQQSEYRCSMYSTTLRVHGFFSSCTVAVRMNSALF